MARAMEPYDLFWVEIDTRDPKALAYIRSRTTIPVASCECLFGRRDYRPFFEKRLHGRRHHRRAVERLLRVAQDRGDGRRLRDQRRAPQLLRSPVDA